MAQTYGPAPYGPATPAVAAAVPGPLFVDPVTGVRHGSRQIDPVTRDYVINSTGRYGGMSSTKQLVYLAVCTNKGSSAVRTLGQELRLIDRITSNFNRRADTTLREAVQHLVIRGLIEVIGTVVVRVRPGVEFISFQWRDLDTGHADETPILPAGTNLGTPATEMPIT